MNIILCLWGKKSAKNDCCELEILNFEPIPMVIKMIPKNINKYNNKERINYTLARITCCQALK